VHCTFLPQSSAEGYCQRDVVGIAGAGSAVGALVLQLLKCDRAVLWHQRQAGGEYSC
jgi:hypothetical protein